MPVELRARVWARLSGSDLRRTQAAGGAESYEALLRRCEEEPVDAPLAGVVESIDRDIPRTFASHVEFQDNPAGQARLRRLLIALAARPAPRTRPAVCGAHSSSQVNPGSLYCCGKSA